VIQFDVEPGAAQIVLGHGAQHCGFVRTADEYLADEFPRVNRFTAGEAMVTRHQNDQRLVVHHLVAQVEGRLDAQEGHVEPAADERLGEVRRIVARDVTWMFFSSSRSTCMARGSQFIS